MLGGAGIVDENVETAPRRRRGGDLLAILVARDVALHDEHFGARLAAEIGGLFRFLLAVGIIDDDLRAALGQNGRGRGPQSRSRPRHDRAQTILGHPFPLVVLSGSTPAVAYHIARQSPGKSKLRSRGIPRTGRPSCPRRMQPCGGRLSGLWLFLIIKRKKRPHPMPGHCRSRGAKSTSGNAVAESENIVVETAEKIFADLADAQTINRDKKGEWKAPLWQALSEAGLPLAWVPRRLRRLGREPCRRIWRAERRRPPRHRRAAGRNHAGGLAAGAGQNLLARRRDDGGAGRAKGPHHAQCRRHPLRPRPRRAVCKGGKAFCRAAPAIRSRWSMQQNAGSRPASALAATTATPSMLDKVEPISDQARAKGF